MNIFMIIMRGKPSEPLIDIGNDGQLRATCHRCRYWSGRIGNAPSDLVCAVNVPRPTEEELATANHRPAYALHDCPDFELKQQPESRTIQLHR